MESKFSIPQLFQPPFNSTEHLSDSSTLSKTVILPPISHTNFHWRVKNLTSTVLLNNMFDLSLLIIKSNIKTALRGIFKFVINFLIWMNICRSIMSSHMKTILLTYCSNDFLSIIPHPLKNTNSTQYGCKISGTLKIICRSEDLFSMLLTLKLLKFILTNLLSTVGISHEQGWSDHRHHQGSC